MSEIEARYSIGAARAYFNRFGALLWLPNLVDAPIYQRLLVAGSFHEAKDVFELGPGRGFFAGMMLGALRREDRRMVLAEASDRLADRLRERFRREDGVSVRVVSTPPPFDLEPRTFDRFVSCFVLDVMDGQSRRQYIAEARRLLRPGGLACLMFVTHGVDPASRALMRVGYALARISPGLALGARFADLCPHFQRPEWEVLTSEVHVSMGCATHLLVAKNLAPAPEPPIS